MANLYGQTNTNQSLTGNVKAKNPLSGNLFAKGNPGKDGVTPHIGENGNWFIGDTDMGIKAQGADGMSGKDGTPGADGKDGVTPHIGENGNWFIGETDTGVKALGEEGPPGRDGAPGADGVDGKDGEPGKSGVYVGSGEMPEDCNIQIDPSGETHEYVTKKEFNEFSNTLSGNMFIPIQDKVSGDNITITDSAKAPLKNLKLFGKSEQFTTGGNQLLRYPFHIISLEDGGVICTDNEDSSLHLKGTAVREVYFNYFLNEAGKRLPMTAGTYTISAPSLQEVLISGNVLDSDGNRLTNGISMSKNSTKITFTLDKDGEMFLYAYVISGKTVDETVRIMLNSGTTALPWEPYTGGVPSPNPQYPQEIESVGNSGDVEVGVYNGNLADQSNAIIKGTSARPYIDGKIYLSYKISPHGRVARIPFDGKKGTTYYVKWRVVKNPNNVKIQTYLPELEQYFSTRYFVPNEDVTMIGIYVGADVFTEDTEIILDNIIVSEVDIPYEPYNKQSLTIPTPNGLPGIKVTDATLANYTDLNGDMYCCDEINLERGKYIQRIIKHTLDGSEFVGWYANPPWHMSKKALFGSTIDLIGPQVQGIGTYAMSDRFAIQNTDYQCRGDITQKQMYYSVDGECFTVNANLLFETQDGEGFKKFFSENPTTIYAILKTPIETDLTEEQIEQYKALTTNYPNTTILSDAHMEVEYIADTKKYIDKKFAEIASALV